MTDTVTQIIVMSHEPRLLVGTSEGRVFTSSAHNGKVKREFKGLEGSAIRSLYWAENCSLVMASDIRGRVVIWEWKNLTIIDEFSSPYPVVQCAAFRLHHYLTLDNHRCGTIWTQGIDSHLISTPICEKDDEQCFFDQFSICEDGAKVVLRNGFQWRIWALNTHSTIATHEPVDGMQLDYLSGDIGLSNNGEYFYVYWDDYIVFDTSNEDVLREHPILIDPQSTALSDNGQFLVIGGEEGDVVILGPEGNIIFEKKVAEDPIQNVGISSDGRFTTFVDDEGGCGCIDVLTGTLLLDRDKMKKALCD